MVVVKADGMVKVELYWDDLSENAKATLTEAIGDNHNYDVFPITELIYEDE